MNSPRKGQARQEEPPLARGGSLLCKDSRYRARRLDKTGAKEHNRLMDIHLLPFMELSTAQGRKFSPAERLWSGAIETQHGCWEWARAKTEGYGRLFVNGKYKLAHRLAYELACGEIPDGMVIDHVCHNRACIKPDHLEAVSVSENLMFRSTSPLADGGLTVDEWRELREMKKRHALETRLFIEQRGQG